MAHLKSLTLHKTSGIEGSIEHLSNLTTLNNLQIGFNDKISGNISSLCEVPFVNLKLFDTGVTGFIPECFTNRRFSRLVLDSNEITGSMPSLNAEYFSATWNYISCPLPNDATISNALLLPGTNTIHCYNKSQILLESFAFPCTIYKSMLIF